MSEKCTAGRSQEGKDFGNVDARKVQRGVGKGRVEKVVSKRRYYVID
ncbi:hypothetical protein QG37_08044 [Candidozyma auris]|uniref:Uncharacterized protein n=1 Tax=Candidozyma auris TaxID=498019 RepID=A0A0L0NNJ2_CANAR|nr:hypothetical protein QG37_08044 [[Candida] auris]